jgi:hypothetical protein
MEMKETEAEGTRLNSSKIENFEVDGGGVIVEEFRPIYLVITII